MIKQTPTEKLSPITRGSDWFEVITGTKDGVPYDMRLYDWECHFKYEEGIEKAIVVEPEIIVEESQVMLKLNDSQTELLTAGVLFFSLLRTSSVSGWDNGYTEPVLKGTVLVDAGVTNHAN